MAQYTGLYGTDLTPEELESGFLDISQAAGTPTYKIPEFDRYSYAARNYGALPSMYELYLSGGFDAAQDDFVTPPVQNFTGGEMIDTGGGGAQIPGAMDSLVTAPTVDQMTFQDVVDSDANPGFVDTPVDTTMPANLTSGMGMGADTVVDTSLPQGSPGMLNPPQSNLENEMRAKALGYTPDIAPTEVAGVPIKGRQTELMSRVEPEIETRPPEFVTGIQPEEETYADLLERTPMNLVRGPSGVEFTVNPETGVVQPGIVEDIVEEPEYSDVTTAVAPPSILSPEPAQQTAVAPQTTFGDPVDVEQGFTADPIDFSAPGTLADPAEKQDIESLPAQEQDTFLSDIANQLGGIWDNTSKTIDIAGQKINPFVAGVKGAINKYIFGGLPVTFVFDALGAMGIKPGYSDQTKAAQYIGLAKEGETQDIYGINTQSMFGDYDQYNIDRVEELEDIVDDQLSRGLTNTIQMQELEKRNTYNRMASGDIDDDPTGDAQIAEDIALQDRIDAGIEAADEEPAPSGDGPQEVDAGTADVQDYADIYEPPTPAPAPSPAPSYSPPSPHGNGGGGNGAGAGGGSQQATSGGGFSSGWGGGWGWSKGGIVSLKNGKR